MYYRKLLCGKYRGRDEKPCAWEGYYGRDGDLLLLEMLGLPMGLRLVRGALLFVSDAGRCVGCGSTGEGITFERIIR